MNIILTDKEFNSSYQLSLQYQSIDLKLSISLLINYRDNLCTLT